VALLGFAIVCDVGGLYSRFYCGHCSRADLGGKSNDPLRDTHRWAAGMRMRGDFKRDVPKWRGFFHHGLGRINCASHCAESIESPPEF
jgi:hypothetical protein